MPCPSTGPNWFWTVQIDIGQSEMLLLGPNCFGQVQIILFWSNFYNLDLSKIIWIRPQQIEPIQNDWYSTKIFWKVQNHQAHFIVPLSGFEILLFIKISFGFIKSFGIHTSLYFRHNLLLNKIKKKILWHWKLFLTLVQTWFLIDIICHLKSQLHMPAENAFDAI